MLKNYLNICKKKQAKFIRYENLQHNDIKAHE